MFQVPSSTPYIAGAALQKHAQWSYQWSMAMRDIYPTQALGVALPMMMLVVRRQRAKEVSGVQYSAALIAPAFDSSSETSSLGPRRLSHNPLDSSVRRYMWCSQGTRKSMIDLSSQSITLEC